jgi:DNA polymerase-3 subunit delta
VSTIDTLAKLLDRSPEPYYIMAADDDYLIREFLENLKLKIFGGTIDSSAVTFFDFGEKNQESTIGDAIETAMTESMFSSVKLVVIKEIYKLKKDELERLLEYLPKVPSGTHLVLTTSGELTAARKETLKAKGIKPSGIIDITGKNDGAAPIEWAANYLKKSGLNMDPEVLEFIAAESNGDISTIKNEIDKLLLFTSGRNEITKADFNRVRGVNREYDIWAFINAVLSRNESQAFIILNAIYEDSGPELVLGTLFASVRDIYTYILYERNGKIGEIRNILGGKAYFIQKENRTRFFKRVQYIDLVSIFREADKKIKLSSRDLSLTVITIMLQKIFLKLAEKNA